MCTKQSKEVIFQTPKRLPTLRGYTTTIIDKIKRSTHFSRSNAGEPLLQQL